MKSISLELLMYIHEQTLLKHGGLEGVKNIALIESALNTPFLTFGGEDLNKTTLDKISALTYSLVNNHGFEDGNKRVGTITMGILCQLNNIKLEYNQEELIEFGLRVGDNKLSKEGIKDWIIQHMV